MEYERLALRQLMKIQFIAILFVIFFISCSGHDSKDRTESLVGGKSIVHINIPDVLKEESVELYLSDEVDKIDIVPLETTEHSLLSTIVDVFSLTRSGNAGKVPVNIYM